MGLFSSKKKTVIGVTAIDLGSEGYSEYSKFRRDLTFAVNGNTELYMQEMFKYKQKVRHKYSSSRLAMYGVPPINADVPIETLTVITQTYADHPNYYNVRYPNPIEPRDASYQENNDPNVPLDLDEAMKIHRAKKNFANATEMDIPNIGKHGWTTSVDGASDDTIDARFLVYTNTSQSLSIPYLRHVSFDIYHQKVKIVDGETVHDETVIIESITNGSYNLKQYAWRGLAIYTEDFNVGLTIIRHNDATLNASSTITTNMDFEPLVSLKEANSSALTDPNASEQDRLQAFAQKKILDSVGMNFDSAKTYIENDKIQDFKVGMMYNLDKVNENHGVMKSFFQSLEIISNGVNRYNVGSDYIDNRNFYPINSLTTIVLPFNNMNMEISFQLDRVTRTTTTLLSQKKKCKIKLISKNTLIDMNTPDMVELYEGLYGDSNGLTVHQMREAIVSDYNSSNSPSDELKEAYNSLPTIKDLSNSYDAVELVLYVPSAYTSISQIETYLLQLDEEKYSLFNVESFKYINGSNESDRYRYNVTKQYVTAISEYADFDGKNDMAKYVIRKIDTNTNEEIVFVLTGLKLKYSDSLGHKYTSYCQKGSATFIFPVPHGSLDNMSFYDFIESYDAMLTGVAFSVQTIRIKWYQRGWFAVVLQIVMIVIAVVVTVYTGGYGASVASALVDFAINYAVAYGISVAVGYIAEQLGVDSGIAQIASLVITAVVTGNTEGLLPQLGLTVADEAIKYQTIQYQHDTERIMRQQNELERKIKHLSLLMNQGDNSFSRWAIIDNVINSSESMNPSNSSMNISEEYYSIMKDKEKYSVLPQVPFLPLDLQEVAELGLNHAESQYSVEYDIENIHRFGDNTNL